MKYHYEYKEKNGRKIIGRDLEVIEFYDNNIRLFGIVTINQLLDKRPWQKILNMEEIEYLKICPMIEKEGK